MVGSIKATLHLYDQTNFHKLLHAESAHRRSSTVFVVSKFGLVWENASAITKMDLTTNSGEDFAENTVFVLLGHDNLNP